MAYIYHTSTHSNQDLGTLVEVVIAYQTHQQEQWGGVKDVGWMYKERNVLIIIKKMEDLYGDISYLQEEIHTILETCAGNMESTLVNVNVDECIASQVVVDYLDFRITRKTITSYTSLLSHLVGVSNTNELEKINIS